MSQNVISMDYEAVGQIARGFDHMVTFLEGVDKALEGAMILLRTAAFMGLVAAKAMEAYLQNIRTQINALKSFCQEMNNDVNRAIVNYQNQDYSSAGRFG